MATVAVGGVVQRDPVVRLGATVQRTADITDEARPAGGRQGQNA